MTKLARTTGQMKRVAIILLSGLALASCASVTTPPKGDTARDQRGQSLIQLGDVARQSSDLAGAVKLYRTALTGNPDQVDVLLVLGGTLFQGGDNAEAIESYNKAMTLDPHRVDAHLGLGRVYLAESKPNQARVEFAAALQTDPKNIQAFNGMGVALDMSGQHFDAQQSYRNGLAFAPDNSSLHNNLGLSQAISGDYDKAVVELSHLSLEPGAIPRTRQNLALALGLKGDAQGAARLLRADLDEQTVNRNLRYFAAVRQLTQSSGEWNLPVLAATASLSVPGAVATASPHNPPPDRSIEHASQTSTLPQHVEVASIATAPRNRPADLFIRAPVQAAKSIYVAAGAYSVMDNAKVVEERLKPLGAQISTITRAGRQLYCVQVGPAQDMKAAAKLLSDVHNLGQNDARIVVD